MTTDPQLTAWLDQEDAHLAQVIRARRWAVQYVGAGTGPDEPPFGYTIGLFGLGHPELVVVGLPPDVTHAVLDPLAVVVADGRDLLPGEVVSSPEDGRPLVVEELPNPGDVVLVANRFYQRPAEYSVPAYQLAWPTDDALFPWDDGYPAESAWQPRPGTWRA
jgi:Domain of unknown function (DUF4262)